MAFLKSIWKANSKHKKLSEELALQNAKEAENEHINPVENESDVITFKLKYLGSTVVKYAPGEYITHEPVKTIIKTTKASRKKLQRCNIAISLKGIAVTDQQGNDILKVSIYRISNCSTDATHRQIFSFISTDENETMECHAFLCPKRKLAETVTLAVAHAFSTAYEAWRILPRTKEFEKNGPVEAVTPITAKPTETLPAQKTTLAEEVEEKLIDLDNEVFGTNDYDFGKCNFEANINSAWVCFDDDFLNEVPRTPCRVDLVLA